MLRWLILLIRDSNGEKHEAVQEYQRELQRSRSETEKMASALKKSREAIHEKAEALSIAQAGEGTDDHLQVTPAKEPV